MADALMHNCFPFFFLVFRIRSLSSWVQQVKLDTAVWFPLCSIRNPTRSSCTRLKCCRNSEMFYLYIFSCKIRFQLDSVISASSAVTTHEPENKKRCFFPVVFHLSKKCRYFLPQVGPTQNIPPPLTPIYLAATPHVSRVRLLLSNIAF